MKGFAIKISGLLASLALLITTYNANVACIFLVHQPQMPKGAQKLRKF